MKFISMLLLSMSPLLSIHAFAYPEMVRAGYVNCNSCHVSMNGGGVLNDYGRKLSKEELALWKNPSEKSTEEQALYGVMADSPIQKWLKLGGDVRSVYYYVNSANVEMGETILMQADFQAAATFDQWTLVGAAGVTQTAPGKTVEFLSRNHYLLYELSDEIHFRAGKFIPAYGINTPDHTSLTRSPLELGYNYESYNVEASYISEKWNWFASGIFGRPDDTTLNQDKGFAIQGSYSTSERVKFGLNTWYGKKVDTSRWLFGGFAMVGFTKEFFGSTEIDVKSYKDSDHGIATTQKLSYELTDGLWLYGMQEYGTTNIPATYNTTSQVYGAGFQFFPRTHFEFNLAYEKILNQSVAGARNTFTGMDTIWLMSHFYL